MIHRAPTADPSLSLAGWGTARADVPAIPALRKAIPTWAPKDTPGHFLKHADEQTVLAVSAVDRAIASTEIPIDECRQWAILAAPRFIGRFAGIATLDRYTRGGGPAISPHLIPQHSLHSISGALSVLLQSRQANCGVGGTTNSLAESIFAALTFPAVGARGLLLVATSWEPEPQFGADSQCVNQPVCHAVALALRSAAGSNHLGTLRTKTGTPAGLLQNASAAKTSAADLCCWLENLIPGGPAADFELPLPWGAAVVLQARAPAARRAAAA